MMVEHTKIFKNPEHMGRMYRGTFGGKFSGKKNKALSRSIYQLNFAISE
jgi:hypothetical protein